MVMSGRLQVQQSGHDTRHPFSSPCPSYSTASINETDDGSTSGQDEFHLERYSSNAKYQHLRQISRSSNGDTRDKKPDLAIITNFGGPIMPMKSAGIVVNEVPSRQAQADRKKKALSIVSHKAVHATTSPEPSQRFSPQLAMSASEKIKLGLKQHKNSRKTLKSHAAPTGRPRATEKIPIGISLPSPEAALLENNNMNSALTIVTPETPAIVVTPATGPQSFQTKKVRSPSPKTVERNPRLIAIEVHGRSTSPSSIQHTPEKADSSYPQQITGLDSAESARPKSQGWWNLMLSPLLHGGSLASRKNFQAATTPPVPPVPFPTTKLTSPALSSRSGTSKRATEPDVSPDTPRRKGLAFATTPASTWSRWTEWETEREAHEKPNEVEEMPDIVTEKNFVAEQGDLPILQSTKLPGLAAEYFHACAIEQLTGVPYFECVNHSCADQLPKLRSVRDKPLNGMLASPFQSPQPEKGSLLASKEMVSSKLSVGHGFATHVDNEKQPDDTSNKAQSADTSHGSITRVADKDRTTSSVSTKPALQTRSLSTDSYKVPEAATAHAGEIKVIHILQHHPSGSSSSGKENSIVIAKPVESPGPLSPDMHKTMAPQEAVALTTLQHQMSRSQSDTHCNQSETLPQRPAFITADTEYPILPPRVHVAPITLDDLETRSRRVDTERRRQRHEKEDQVAKKVGGLWRGRGCFSSKGCMGRGGPESRTRRRWIICISVLVLAIIIISIVLAVTLTRWGDATPVESQWLNLTGFPAMPIGILTIAAPNLVASENECTAPTTMWSCAVPKDQQDQIGSNEPDQPNFRFEIKFRNGTVPGNMTIPLPGTKPLPTSTSSDPFTDDLFVANPSAPNQPDQVFLGQTTDNITIPFDGEDTPFYMSFMSAFPQIPSAFNNTLTKSIARRSINSTLDAIPAPAVNSDGTAAQAALVPISPFPIAQPIRLYNRGLQDEHYGFYTYYDKSIYLSGVSIDNGAPSAGSTNAIDADQNGGSFKSQAQTVCTFSQTRFLIKIFTNPAYAATLLPSTINPNLTAPEDHKAKNKPSSATDFDRPGSFQYPTTIVADRHGGDIDKKAIYCYGMQNGEVLTNSKMLNGEIRSIGGQLINAAPGLIGDDTSFNSTAGGIDGGTGGCSCSWQNWT